MTVDVLLKHVAFAIEVLFEVASFVFEVLTMILTVLFRVLSHALQDVVVYVLQGMDMRVIIAGVFMNQSNRMLECFEDHTFVRVSVVLADQLVAQQTNQPKSQDRAGQEALE